MFIKFTQGSWRSQEAITVNKNVIYVSKSALKALGIPKYVDIYYDMQANAIRFEIKSKDACKLTVGNYGTGQISSKIGKLMPTGKYIMQKDNIFILSQCK